jgi:hypothetical protein
MPSILQIRTVLSALAVASQDPPGAIATAVTAPWWPVRVLISRPGRSDSRLPTTGMTQAGTDWDHCQRRAP